MSNMAPGPSYRRQERIPVAQYAGGPVGKYFRLSNPVEKDLIYVEGIPFRCSNDDFKSFLGFWFFDEVKLIFEDLQWTATKMALHDL